MINTIGALSEWLSLHPFVAYVYLAILFIIACFLWLHENSSTTGKFSFIHIHSARLRLGLPTKYHGITLGKVGPFRLYSPENSDEHIIVTGATGDGKTSPFAIPSMLSWIGNFWTFDISGDISAAVHKVGQLVFEPLNYLKSIPYNMFYLIDREMDRIMQDKMLLNLALLLVPQIETSGAGFYFENGAREIVSAAFLTFYHIGMDFAEICYKVVSTGYAALFKEIKEIGYEPAIIHLHYFEGAERTSDIEGCKNKANSCLQFFSTEDMRMLLRRPREKEIALHAASIERHSCFLKIPDTYLKQYAPLIELIVYQLFEYLSGRKEGLPKVLIVLDEYGSFKNMDLSDAFQKYRKRNIRMMILVQSLLRVDQNFSPEYRKDLVANCKLNIVSGEAEPDMQDYYSRKAGTNTVTVRTKDKNGEVLSTTEEEHRFVQPYELARLSAKQKSLVIANGYAFVLKQARYYKERSYKRNRSA